MRCRPMAESLFTLELEFLHIGGGCSLITVFVILMLVGICCVNKKSSFSHLDSSSK